MSDDHIKEIPQPDGTIVRVREVSFDINSEDWNEYQLEDGTKLRLKNTLIQAFRVVDENGEPKIDDNGNPEVIINGHVIILATK